MRRTIKYKNCYIHYTVYEKGTEILIQSPSYEFFKVETSFQAKHFITRRLFDKYSRKVN